MEDNNSHTPSIKERVLEKIKDGKVAMHSHAYFSSKHIFQVTVLVMVLASLMLLMSFLIFVFRTGGQIFFPWFGVRGVQAFVSSVPWLLIVLVLVGLYGAELLLRKYRFAYRTPMLFILGVLGIVSILGGFLLSQTSLHDNLLLRARDHRLPFGEGLYRNYGLGEGFKHATLGTITSLSVDGCGLVDFKGEQIYVRFTDAISDFVVAHLYIGDRVVVLGDRKGSSIEAFGIKKLSPRRGGPDMFSREQKIPR